MCRFTPDDAKQALKLAQSATAADPHLAKAWTALVWANVQNARWAQDPRPFYQAAVEGGRRAVEADRADAEAHAAYGEALAILGDFAQAKLEYDRALELNPGSADILTFYSGWASTFGQPEAGAAAADRAIRLNPNYPRWAIGGYFAWAYFITGRYGDVVRVMSRLPAESHAVFDWVMEAGSLAMLGRVDEAKALVQRALAADPETSIEREISQTYWPDEDRPIATDVMRKAGFPACANPELLAQLDKPVRLPECEAERAKAASAAKAV